MTTSWQPTHALLRAALASVTFAVVAVARGRADLLVIAVPLLLWTVAAVVRRPAAVPQVRDGLLHDSVREGEGTVLRTVLHDSGGVEHAVVRVARHRWLLWRPSSGVAGVTAGSPRSELRVDVPVSSRRWGSRRVGEGLVAATSPWAAYRWGPHALHGHTLTTLPVPGRFDTKAPAPHPIGLVGTHPSRRVGGGTELAGIRPFQPGDRLRRLHWPVSLRTGTLHVTSTLAEEDSSILLVVDAGVSVGGGGGLDEPAGSLDVAVRAAGAVAEHYLHRGDRVGLRVLGSTERNAVHTSTGRRHLLRILDTLARIVPGERRSADPSRIHFGVSGGTVVIMLSPMLSDQAVTATLTLARQGLSVIVVDTLPDDAHLAEKDRRVLLAWRMRLLEREALLSRVQLSGTPVVAWRGPGTLDEVLRRLGRRASLPRLVRR